MVEVSAAWKVVDPQQVEAQLAEIGGGLALLESTIQVFGNRDTALRNLGSPDANCNNRVLLEVAWTPEGLSQVREIPNWYNALITAAYVGPGPPPETRE